MPTTIVSAQLFALDIPFRLAITHASHTRSSCDSVVLRIESSDGTVGYGEAVPRPYVTGETVQGVMGKLEQHIKERVIGQELPIWRGNSEEIWDKVASLLPPSQSNSKMVAGHAASAALELALLDCIMSCAGKPLSAMLPPGPDVIIYSGMLPSVSVKQALELARQTLAYGITHIKLKVGDEKDVARVRSLREAVGPDIDLYVDANCAWSFEQAVERIEQLAEFDISLVEQPIPRGDIDELAQLRKLSSVPIMVDESLITLADGRALIDAGACDFFNIRVSKCGGLSNCLSLARMASSAGLQYQVGAHVGETAILSAAGRHLGLALPEARYIEGSSGGFLLSEDLCTPAVQFEPGGKGYPLTAPGLGVNIELSRLQRLSKEQRLLGRTQ